MKIKPEPINELEIPADAQEILAQVEIVKKSNSQLFRAVPLQVLTGPEGKNFKVELVSTPHIDVTLSGSKAALDTMKKEELKAYVDISGFNEPGLYSVNASCSTTRQDVHIESIYPIQIQIKLTKIN